MRYYFGFMLKAIVIIGIPQPFIEPKSCLRIVCKIWPIARSLDIGKDARHMIVLDMFTLPYQSERSVGPCDFTSLYVIVHKCLGSLIVLNFKHLCEKKLGLYVQWGHRHFISM